MGDKIEQTKEKNETIILQNTAVKQNDSITLGDLISAIWKNIILIGIITVVITIIGAVYTFGIAKEKYTSSSTVVVAKLDQNDNYDYVNSLRIVNTVAGLVKEDVVLDKAAYKTNTQTDSLRKLVSVDYNNTSLLIKISVTSEDNEKTKAYANAITDALIEVSNSPDYEFINGAISQTTPAKDGIYASPNKTLYLLVSFMAGVVLSLVVVFIKEFLSTKFKNKKDVEGVLNENIVGIFYDNKKLNKNDGNYELLEPTVHNFDSYNKLLNNIKYSNLENPYKVIMISSSNKDELKSTTIANLANCMVHNNKKVVVIDLDIRKPVIHKYFGVSNTTGLVDYIEGSIKKEELIKSSEAGVDVITVGKKVLNPVVIIDSKALALLIEELKNEYDYVLVDTCPVSVGSDACAVSKLCDGVIFNIAMNSTKKSFVKESISEIKFINSNIIGVNLTKYPLSKAEYYSYSKYYEED